MCKARRLLAWASIALLPITAGASDNTVCFNIDNAISLRLDTTWHSTSIAINGMAIAPSYFAPVTGTAILIPGGTVVVGLSAHDAAFIGPGPLSMELTLEASSLSGEAYITTTDFSIAGAFPVIPMSCGSLPFDTPQIYPGAAPDLLD